MYLSPDQADNGRKRRSPEAIPRAQEQEIRRAILCKLQRRLKPDTSTRRRDPKPARKPAD